MMRLTEGPDSGAVWHYGDPLREQRELEAGRAAVDLSHLPVVAIAGPDRLTWLHAVTSQKLDDLKPGVWTSAYVLNHQGHISHAFTGVDDGETFTAVTELGHAEALIAWLERMRFAARVEISRRPELALVQRGAPSADHAGKAFVPLTSLDVELGDNPAGVWAYEALRIAAGIPRAFVDTDDRTIPNEIASPDADVLGQAVHLRKGCYPGQEVVARIYTLGRPPRRLTLLHLDGHADALPSVGSDVFDHDLVVGRMGSSARHWELGPIGLALIKRSTGTEDVLTVTSEDDRARIAASQEVLVDPEVGLHVRPKLG